MQKRVLASLGGILLLCGALAAPARAQEPAATNPEIERLKAQLAAQQEQIDQLRRVLDEQKKVLDQATQPKPPSLGQVASTSAIIPPGDAAPSWFGRCISPGAVGYRARIALANTYRHRDHHPDRLYGFDQRLPLGGRGQRHRQQLRQHPIQQRVDRSRKIERGALQRAEQPYRRARRRHGTWDQGAGLLGI
jgi:hypothetical protein